MVAVVAGGLVAVVAAAVVLSSRDDAGFARTGSVRLAGSPSALLERVPPPESYRIDYRVEGYGGDDPIVTSDRLWVRRPFESRLEVFPGPEPEGDPDAVQVGELGAFAADGSDADRVVVAAPPGPPASDVRVAAALSASLADGRVELRERRQVLGRTCQVIRSAAVFAAGELARGDAEDHADTCIDAQGLVLEELVVSGGEPLLRRVAIDVQVDPPLDGVSFDLGDPTVPVDQGGGFVAETEPDSRQPGVFYESRPPEGFRRLGRFLVVPPQHENFTDITRRPLRLTFVSDVFVSGADVVVLDQGGTLGGVEPFSDLTGVAVEVEGLGAGFLRYESAGAVVVVPRPDGKFLRARGTTTPGVLLSVLERLEQVEGGELRLQADDQRGGG